MKLRNKLKSGIILILTLLFIVIISNFVSAEEVIGEVGNVTVTDSLVWTWIDFEASYDSTPVIIATITTMNNCPGTCSGTSSGNGGNTQTPLIADVTTLGFNFSMCIDAGSTTCATGMVAETFDYFVFNVDVADTLDWIEVGTKSATTNGANTAISYTTSFAGTPDVWTTAQTYAQAGEIGAHSWIDDKTASGANILGCVHTGTADACDTNNPAETFGYVAIDISEEAFGAAVNFQAGSADQSNADWKTATFSPSFTNPRIMVTQNDDDGGQDPEYPQARSVTTTGAEFRFCEQDAGTVCNSHTSEWVFWFAMEEEVYNLKTGVAWNETLIDMGAGLIADGNITYDLTITAIGNNSDVNVTCVSGNCSNILSNWTDGSSMVKDEISSVEINCVNSTVGDFSVLLNITSAEALEDSQLNASCSISDSKTVTWKASTLDLGNVYDGLSVVDSKSFVVAGSNTNIFVNEISGNGTSFITPSPIDIGALGGGSEQSIEFNCSPLNGYGIGTYQGIYNVNSTEDTVGNNITVSCTVEESLVDWSAASLNLGNVYAGNSVNDAANVISTGYNENVTIYEDSGTGSGFTAPNSTNPGNMTDLDSAAITFTCSPISTQTPGGYSTTYTVNSTYDEVGDDISVSCTVLAPLIDWSASTLSLGSSLNSGNGEGTLDITSTGSSNGIYVSCISGDCTNITDDFADDQDKTDGQSVTVTFSCDDSVVGDYSATFRSNSTENPTGDETTVSCSILQTYGWLNISLVYPPTTGSTNITVNTTTSVNASVECVGALGAICAEVNGLVRDNSTSIYGTGADGSKTVTVLDTIINNYTYINLSVLSGGLTISVNDSSEFLAGDEIMIIQIQNGSGCIAGEYEFREITDITDDIFTLDVPIQNNYCYNAPNIPSNDCTETYGQESSLAQVVRVPNYDDVTINAGATITAPAWNGYVGGLVVFRTNGTVTNNGEINVTGKGYRGGQDGGGDDSEGGQGEGTSGLGVNPPMNEWEQPPNQDWEVTDGYCMQDPNGIGGSGSWCSNDNGGDQGAGGGHGTAGGDAAQDQGQATSEGGYVIGSVDLTKIYFGGGGGAGSDNDDYDPEGDGGAGGGIIYIVAKSINGNISSKGADGLGSSGSVNSASGGGGAGGTIWLRADSITITNVTANGGVEWPDDNDIGGYGGVGRIRLDSLSVTGTPTPVQGHNGTMNYLYPISSTSSPFFADNIIEDCGIISGGESCDLSWDVNHSGIENVTWLLDVVFFSNSTIVETNNTRSSMVNITAALVNNVPTLTDFAPLNDTIKDYNTIGVNNVIMNVTYTDIDGELGTINFINISNGALLCTNSSISSGTTVGCLYTAAYDEEEVKWTANATDGNDWATYDTYNFTFISTLDSGCTYGGSGNWNIENEICYMTENTDIGTNYLNLIGTSGLHMSAILELGGRNVSSASYVNISDGGKFNWTVT